MRAVLGLLPLCLAAAEPSAWVPMRWHGADPQSLELLAGSPVNCLVTRGWTPEFARAAGARGIDVLALVAPDSDLAAEAGRAAAAKLPGLVLEGDFPDGTVAKVKAAFHGVVVELPSRSRMRLDSDAPIVGSYQGVWPGIQIEENGAAKSGPTGSAWIDTNAGFLRSARSWDDATVWISNQPPPKNIITGERYLQAIADAAISGARWVISLDEDFTARWLKHEEAAVRDWKRIAETLRYFEAHPEWRAMNSYGRLVLVQDPSKGGLLSGGILDMIASKHTPVRPVPRQHLTPQSLQGANMAVNVDAEALTAEQRDILRNFTRSGGTLLTGPPGWKDEGAQGKEITLDKKELERLNDIWRDVQSMVGRKNLGVRLFNVSSMLSNLLATPDGKEVVVHLVNYSGYNVENIAVHFLGKYSKATLIAPGAGPKPLEIYPTEEGGGVDVPEVGVCAAVILQ